MKAKVRLTAHAELQAKRRGLDREIVVRVAENPEQTIGLEGGREVRQSQVKPPGWPEPYLVRVIVEAVPGEVSVVTVYRTSKIGKYWRPR